MRPRSGTDGTQVAVFGDRVGTSSVKVLRVIGLALGVGVKRNVLNLYKFLCRVPIAGSPRSLEPIAYYLR